MRYVESGLIVLKRLSNRDRDLPSRYRYDEVAVGGTFDILHVGHERLLARAFHLGKSVFIGVSGDVLVASLGKDHTVRPFRDRRHDLRKFLRLHGWLKRAKVVELKDRFGPAARRRSLNAIVVSSITKRSGLEVNSARVARGLPPLSILVVKMARGIDGKTISTTRIRRGEIDPCGIPIRSRSTRIRRVQNL